MHIKTLKRSVKEAVSGFSRNALIQRFCADERGAVVIVFALVLVVLLGFVALGVDLSSLYFRQKSLQTHADLAAISAVSNLHNDPAKHARTTVLGNGLGEDDITRLDYARYNMDVSLAYGDRLTERELSAPGVNAATVQLQDSVPLYFAQNFLAQDSARIAATATAARFDLASFSLGSRLLSLDGGLLNALLSKALGSKITLNVVDYRALADAQVDLLTFSDALAVRAGLTALTYEELLNSQIKLVDVAGALLDTILDTGGLEQVLGSDGQAVVDIAQLIAINGDTVAAQIGDLLPTITVSALDILMASVDIVNAGHIIETELNLNVPNLLGTKVRLIVGERPAGSGWITLGETGATVHTAQVRMMLDLTLEPKLLSGLTSALNIVAVELPVYLEIASATATLTALNCGALRDDDVLATFDTGSMPLTGITGTHVTELFLGKFGESEFTNTKIPLDRSALKSAKLLGVIVAIPLPILNHLKVRANVLIKSHAAVGSSEQAEAIFTRADEGPPAKSFGSKTLLSSAVTSLLANADPLKVEVDTTALNLGILSYLLDSVVSGVVSTVVSVVFHLLSPILSLVLIPLDTVIDALLKELGIGIGEADLTLHKVHCGRVMLVR